MDRRNAAQSPRSRMSALSSREKERENVDGVGGLQFPQATSMGEAVSAMTVRLLGQWGLLRTRNGEEHLDGLYEGQDWVPRTFSSKCCSFQAVSKRSVGAHDDAVPLLLGFTRANC